jgi:hypothetical protein
MRCLNMFMNMGVFPLQMILIYDVYSFNLFQSIIQMLI